MKLRPVVVFLFLAGSLALISIASARAQHVKQTTKSAFLGSAENNSQQLISQGRQIFRFDSFGDEAFWSGQLQIQQPVTNLTPRTALTGHTYRTMNLAGIFVRENGLFMLPQNKGRFYHDGRFKTLLDVVNSYNERFNLGLSDQEKHDLVEYLKSL